MSKVNATVFETYLEGDYGDVPGIQVTCDRCGYEVEVFGTEENSKARAAIALRDGCPLDQRNFYEVD